MNRISNNIHNASKKFKPKCHPDTWRKNLHAILFCNASSANTYILFKTLAISLKYLLCIFRALSSLPDQKKFVNITGNQLFFRTVPSYNSGRVATILVLRSIGCIICIHSSIIVNAYTSLVNMSSYDAS